MCINSLKSLKNLAHFGDFHTYPTKMLTVKWVVTIINSNLEAHPGKTLEKRFPIRIAFKDLAEEM